MKYETNHLVNHSQPISEVDLTFHQDLYSSCKDIFHFGPKFRHRFYISETVLNTQFLFRLGCDAIELISAFALTENFAVSGEKSVCLDYYKNLKSVCLPFP